MNPHREWFCEYERYNGEVLLGDDRPTKIRGHGRVNLLLKDRRIETLPGVLHILDLARNYIYVSKMGDAGVQIVFKKERYKMFQGAMVLMRGVWCGTLYKILGIIVIDGCSNSIVLESKNEERKFPDVFRGDTMLWHQRLGHIRENNVQ